LHVHVDELVLQLVLKAAYMHHHEAAKAME
jgi:hypothetical protein